MKNKALIIIAVVFVVLIVAGIIVYKTALPQPLNYDLNSIPFVGSEVQIVEEKQDEITVKKNGDDFKVLMFTDLHLDGNNETSSVTVTNLVNNIVREKPDLVILGGDNITSALNGKRSAQLATIFEKLGVYWAGGLGNHEGDNSMSITREEMINLFAKYDHCLIKRGPTDIDGVGNYALTILNQDDTAKHTYYFMDTMDEMSNELKELYGIPQDQSPYDGTKVSQVEWYTAKNNELKEKYGHFESTVVVHIPLMQYKNADKNGDFLYGVYLENDVCESGFDSGLFEAIKKGGTTKSVFCGHDHLNSFGFEYEGILLSYIQPSGYGSYTAASKLGYEEADWLQGYTKLEMGKDGKFTVTPVRNAELAEK